MSFLRYAVRNKATWCYYANCSLAFCHHCSGINILNLDWFDWFSLECLYETNFHTNLLLSTIGPIVFVAFICSLLLGRLLISRRLNPVNPNYTMKDMQKNMILVCLVVAFLAFSPTSTTVFQTFVCEVRCDSSHNACRGSSQLTCFLNFLITGLPRWTATACCGLFD